jgi:CRP-like cAMP-binding protein
LAKGVERVEAPDGTVLIREGDAGDRFFVIEDGEVEISKEGMPIRKLGRGAGFGEIALLRDVPRTATVSAHGVVKLLAVERDDFLQAVTGHPVSRAAAEGIAGARLSEQGERGRR